MENNWPEWNEDMDAMPKDGTVVILRLPDGGIGLGYHEPRNYQGVNFHTSGAVYAGPDPYNEDRVGVSLSQNLLEEATGWLLPPPPEHKP